MLAWMRFSDSSQSLYLEECLWSALKDIGKRINWYVPVDYWLWCVDSNGLKAEDAICIVKLLRKKCSFAEYMDFMLLSLILLLHLKLSVWHKIRIVSLMEISDTQSILGRELDSGCFWLSELGSVAELSCWEQHDYLLEECSCWWRCLHLLFSGFVAWKKPQTPLLPVLYSP